MMEHHEKRFTQAAHVTGRSVLSSFWCMFPLVSAAWFCCLSAVYGAPQGKSGTDGGDGLSKKVVMLIPRVGGGDGSDVVRAVSGQLSDASVKIKFVPTEKISRLPYQQLVAARRLASSGGVMAVFWYDYLSDGEGNLFIYLPKEDRLLIRDVSSSDAGGRWEVLGVIVRSTSDALAGGASLGKSWKRAEPPQKKERAALGRRAGTDSVTGEGGVVEGKRVSSLQPEENLQSGSEPDPESKETDSEKGEKPSEAVSESVWGSMGMQGQGTWGPGMDAAYLLDGYSTDVGATHGFYLGVSFRFLSRWAVVVDYRAQQSVTGSAGYVTTRVTRHPLGLGFKHLWRRGRYGIDSQLSLIMDYSVHVTTTSRVADPDPDTDPDLNPNRDVPGGTEQDSEKGSDLIWSVAALVRGRMQLTGPLSLFMSLGVQVALNPDNHVAEGEMGNDAVIIEPWRVQPLFLLGVTADFF